MSISLLDWGTSVLELRAFIVHPANPLGAIVACWIYNLSHYHCGGRILHDWTGVMCLRKLKLWVRIGYVYIHEQYCAYQITLTWPIFMLLSGVDGSNFLYRETKLICDSLYCPILMVIKCVLWVSLDGIGEKVSVEILGCIWIPQIWEAGFCIEINSPSYDKLITKKTNVQEYESKGRNLNEICCWEYHVTHNFL